MMQLKNRNNEFFYKKISKIKNVLMVLQYSPNKIDVQNERLFLTNLMIENNINFIDTYDIVYNSGYKYSELFLPHHNF